MRLRPATASQRWRLTRSACRFWPLTSGTGTAALRCCQDSTPACTWCPDEQRGSTAHVKHIVRAAGSLWGTSCFDVRAVLSTCWCFLIILGLGQATMDWESQDDGYIAKLLVPDGAKDIAVGDPVAVFVEDKVHHAVSSNDCHAAVSTLRILWSPKQSHL